MNIWLLPRTNQFFKLKPLWRGNRATHKLQTISWIIWILDMNKTAKYKMILHWCFKWTKWNTGLTDWFEKRYEEKGDPEHYGGCSDQVSSTVESKTESLTGTWLAWKCAILVFNWSRHIGVLESSQSLCICLFWLFFVSDNCILNPSAHQLQALGWTWRHTWIWGTCARAMVFPFACPCSLERCEVVVRSKLRDVLWCTWDSCYFTGSWMLALHGTVHLRAKCLL